MKTFICVPSSPGLRLSLRPGPAASAFPRSAPCGQASDRPCSPCGSSGVAPPAGSGAVLPDTHTPPSCPPPPVVALFPACLLVAGWLGSPRPHLRVPSRRRGKPGFGVRTPLSPPVRQRGLPCIADGPAGSRGHPWLDVPRRRAAQLTDLVVCHMGRVASILF